jgi:hypothetical protein
MDLRNLPWRRTSIGRLGSGPLFVRRWPKDSIQSSDLSLSPISRMKQNGWKTSNGRLEDEFLESHVIGNFDRHFRKPLLGEGCVGTLYNNPDNPTWHCRNPRHGGRSLIRPVPVSLLEATCSSNMMLHLYEAGGINESSLRGFLLLPCFYPFVGTKPCLAAIARPHPGSNLAQ